MSDVEATIEALLTEKRVFEPPPGFAGRARVSDRSIYERADTDFEGFWAEQAEILDWFERWDRVLEWNPPWVKWFLGGRLNVAHNCLDRHVEAGNGDRVAFHWRGEEGEERDITYADLHRDVQRFANALKDQGIEKGDVVLLHTGWQEMAGKDAKAFMAGEPGLGKEGAEYLVSKEVVAIGADQWGLEVIPFEKGVGVFHVQVDADAREGVYTARVHADMFP